MNQMFVNVLPNSPVASMHDINIEQYLKTIAAWRFVCECHAYIYDYCRSSKQCCCLKVTGNEMRDFPSLSDIFKKFKTSKLPKMEKTI